MLTLSPLRTVHLALVLARLLAPTASPERPLGLIEALQEHVARCQDYQYDLTLYERKGNQQEERRCRFFVKGNRLVRIRVLQGRDKGSEAVMDVRGRVRARKRGLLKSFVRTLRPDDPRVCSLRGTPFWEAACPNFLKALRTRVTQPETGGELATDPEQPGLTLVTLHRPGEVRERYWIDAQAKHLLKGEVWEGDLLIQRFTVSNIRENVGLSDSFFSL
jgi:outer membrane lipoprotein-sorting protein